MPSSRVGFIGLGRMGEPMALNLVRSGIELEVWNRSASAVERLIAAGASAGRSARDVLRSSAASILMLANDRVIDEVLERQGPNFADNVRGRLIVHMGTTAPSYSKHLEADILAAGGSYVEAPVSGSRKPAEDGALVAMLAGAPAAVDRVRGLMPAMCRDTFVCGPVPSALTTKLAVNVFLITMVSGLAEAMHFAQRHGVDAELFRSILDAGPMASPVSKVKLDKFVHADFTAQASIRDVLMNNMLISDAARGAGIASPLIDVCEALLAETEGLGFAHIDMVGVIKALEARTAAKTGERSFA